jgi:hypothetical protein
MKLFCLLGFCVCLGFVWSFWIAGAVFFGLVVLGQFIIEMGKIGAQRAAIAQRRLDTIMGKRAGEWEIKKERDKLMGAVEVKTDESE